MQSVVWPARALTAIRDTLFVTHALIRMRTDAVQYQVKEGTITHWSSLSQQHMEPHLTVSRAAVSTGSSSAFCCWVHLTTLII